MERLSSCTKKKIRGETSDPGSFFEKAVLLPIMETKRKYLIGLVVLLIAISAIISWRIVDRCTTRLCKLSNIMPQVALVQREVASLPGGVSVPPRELLRVGEIDAGYVGSDGSIVVVNYSAGLVLIAKPKQIGSVVEWDCVSYPQGSNRSASELKMVLDCGRMFRNLTN